MATLTPSDFEEIYKTDYIPETIDGLFEGKHILSVSQFSKTDLEVLFEATRSIRRRVLHHDRGLTQICDGRIMASLFFESSTRTDMSFQAAMRRLGGDVISVSNGIQFSSMYKGENLVDTVRAVACYADVIVLRHSRTGSSIHAAHHLDSLKKTMFPSTVLINAGDGIGEHPTQAVLDLFTIIDKKKEGEDLEITFVGDLLNGRTVHSLVKLIACYRLPNVKLNFVAPPLLRMPSSILHLLHAHRIPILEAETLDGILPQTDVLYWTRVQEERFENPADYEAVKNDFLLLPQTIATAKKDLIIMHPLPRKHEMGTQQDHEILDADPRTVYFEQMKNGMYVRMALLAKILHGAYV